MEYSEKLNRSIAKSRLSVEQVLQIKKLMISTELTDSQLSDIYGVTRQHMNRIRNKTRWGSLDDLMKDDIYMKLTNDGIEDVLKYLMNHLDDYHIDELIIRGKKKKQ